MTTAAPKRAIALTETALHVLPPQQNEARTLAKGVAVTVNGLALTGNPSFAAMDDAVKTLCVAQKGSPFAIGDAVLYCEQRFGERASQIFDVEKGLSERTISVYKWMAERIDKDRRRMDRLTTQHHFLVAKLSAAKQTTWLTRAAADADEKPWSVARLRAEMAEQEDGLPQEYFVVAQVANGNAQAELLDQLEAQGLKCHAQTRKRKKEIASA